LQRAAHDSPLTCRTYRRSRADPGVVALLGPGRARAGRVGATAAQLGQLGGGDDLVATEAPPDEGGEDAEGPPLDGVEQVAQRGEDADLGQVVGPDRGGYVAGVELPTVDRVGDDVPAEQVDADPLGERGDAQLGEDV